MENMEYLKLKFFKLEEFLCRCGCGAGKVEMGAEFLNRLDHARFMASTRFDITSGFRCDKRNRTEGGSETSSHKKGVAGDIAAISSRDRFFILKGLISAGFDRLGIGDDFIHIDTDKSKPAEVCFHYYDKYKDEIKALLLRIEGLEENLSYYEGIAKGGR